MSLNNALYPVIKPSNVDIFVDPELVHPFVVRVSDSDIYKGDILSNYLKPGLIENWMGQCVPEGQLPCITDEVDVTNIALREILAEVEVNGFDYKVLIKTEAKFGFDLINRHGRVLDGIITDPSSTGLSLLWPEGAPSEIPVIKIVPVSITFDRRHGGLFNIQDTSRPGLKLLGARVQTEYTNCNR